MSSENLEKVEKSEKSEEKLQEKYEEKAEEKDKEEVKERAALTRPEVDEKFKELYELVSKEVKEMIRNGKVTPDLVRPVLLIVVRELENVDQGKYAHLDSATKKEYAMAIVEYVFEDLHDVGQINDETYEWIMLGLFFGSELFESIFNSLIDVVEDVVENGCAGCFGRNCGRNKRKNKKN